MAKKQSKPAKKGAGKKRPTAALSSKKVPVKKVQSKKVPAKAVRAKASGPIKKPQVKKAAPKKPAQNKRALPKVAPVKKAVPVNSAKVISTKVSSSAGKAAAPKLPSKLAAKPIAPPEPEITSVPVEPAPVLPTRAPTRKIFGANNKVIAVAEKVIPGSAVSSSGETSSVPSSTASLTPDSTQELQPEEKSALPELPTFVPKLAPVTTSAPLAKVAWDDLPQTVPANVRFLVNSAIKESENASSSPFPFAKFISSLPHDLCGLEFAIMVLNLEHAPDEIGRLCGYSTERVLGLISTGETAITDKFATLCPDMYRKWRAQFAGRTVSVEALIEHHLVSKVDRSFQALLAGVVLSAMGIKSPAFAVPLAAVNLGRVH